VNLEALVTRLGLGDRVRFHGAIPEAARFLSAFDLFVLSSRSEGTPMVVLEAFGSATPVVATAVGGVPDLLENGKAGWLVPPEDPGRLGAVIGEALTGKAMRRAMAERGRGRLHGELGMDAWIRSHLDVYRSAMAIRRRGMLTSRNPLW
jgi:glycosyltransferase involved in cell wall biosynthesis